MPAEDRYTDLVLIERALSLALRVPILSPEEGRVPNLGRSFEELAELVRRFRERFGGLLAQLHTLDPAAEPDRHLTLDVTAWGDTDRHFEYRLKLISLLIELRKHILHSVTVVQIPTMQELDEANREVGIPPSIPVWSDLSETEKRVLHALTQEQPLMGHAIAYALGLTLRGVERQLAELTAVGVLKNTPGAGYSIANWPRDTV